MIKVACGLITAPNDLVFMALRPDTVTRPSMWEYPGGKLELTESYEDALIRELHEELGILAQDPVQVSEVRFDWDKPVELKLFHVIHTGTPQPFAADAIKWADPRYAINHMPLVPSCYWFYRDVINFLGLHQ